MTNYKSDNNINPGKLPSSLKIKILRWVKAVILLYCIIGMSLYYLQEFFLFHPEKLPQGYQYKFEGAFEEMNIPFNETDTLNVVKFYPKDSIRKGVVLYYHGNRQNIERYAKFVPVFTKKGYEVWMEDYPGYGKSTGERTEKKLYEQAMAVYKIAANKYKADSIILYGKSLGTGIAAYVASQTNCQQLILETPYYSIPNLFSCYAPIYPTQRMSNYKIPANEYLQRVKYPITIFHGTNDGVIPYRCANKLKPILKSTDEFVTIDKGTHHNLYGYDLYQKKMDSLLR